MGDSNTQLTNTTSQRKKKGQILKQIDQDTRMIESGSHGIQRLIVNIAVDFQEAHPGLSWDDALKMAIGYYQRVHACN